MRKILISILISTFLILNSLLLPAAAMAQGPAATPAPETTWYNQNFQEWFAKVYDDTNQSEIFGERYTAAQVQWVIYGLFAFLLNSTTNAQVTQCLLANMANIEACKDLLSSPAPTPNLATKEAPKESRTLFSAIFADREFSGVYYVNQKIQNLSLVPAVSAQEGFGYSSALKPVQFMWQTSRDIAFGLFVIASIVFAFMIMFRVKISPQVVISVQSAIPKLIISLVLVAFSFAIAGFLIDLMYVVYGLLSLIGASFATFASPLGVFDFLTRGEIGVGFLGGAGPDLGIFGLFVVYLIFFTIAFLISLLYTVGLLTTLIVSPLLVKAGPALAIIAILLVIFIIFMVIWNGFKTFFALLKAYVNILFLTIFAPIQIVAGTVIPNFGFSTWLRSFVSNLAVFIVASSLFFFAFLFLVMAMNFPFSEGLMDGIVTFITGSVLSDKFLTPSGGWPPLFNTSEGYLPLLLCGASFLMFTLIPKATEIVQGLLSGRPFAYGTAIGEAVAFVPRDVKGAAGSAAGIWAAVSARKAFGNLAGGKLKDTEAGEQLDNFLDQYSKGYFKDRSGTKKPGER